MFCIFSLIEYAFANFFKCSSDRNVWTPGKRAKLSERIAHELLQTRLSDSLIKQPMTE